MPIKKRRSFLRPPLLFIFFELTDDAAVIVILHRRYKSQLTFRIFGHQDHALRHDALDLSGGKVDNQADLLANNVFRFIVFGNAGYNRALIQSRIQGQLQQLQVQKSLGLVPQIRFVVANSIKAVQLGPRLPILLPDLFGVLQ